MPAPVPYAAPTLPPVVARALQAALLALDTDEVAAAAAGHGDVLLDELATIVEKVRDVAGGERTREGRALG